VGGVLDWRRRTALGLDDRHGFALKSMAAADGSRVDKFDDSLKQSRTNGAISSPIRPKRQV
jgi:hypothetical protein